MTGTGSADAIAVGLGVDVALKVGVGVGVPEAFGLILCEGEASKAGTSPACTIKFLVSVLVMPSESTHETVIE